MGQSSEGCALSFGNNDEAFGERLKTVTVRHPHGHVAFDAFEERVEVLVSLLGNRDGGLSEFSVIA